MRDTGVELSDGGRRRGSRAWGSLVSGAGCASAMPGGKCVGCEVAEEVVGDGSRLVATAGELCSVMEY